MRIPRLVFCSLFVCAGALAVGCDEPVPPAAQGAVKYKLTQQPGNVPQCQTKTPNESFGSVNLENLASSSMLVEGEGDARVACTISASGADFNVNASIKLGPNNFSLSGVVSASQPSQVIVNIKADSIKSAYSTNPDNKCTLKAFGDSPLGLTVGGGKLRAILDCPDMIQSGATTDAPRCAITGSVASEPGGYVVFENCDE